MADKVKALHALPIATQEALRAELRQIIEADHSLPRLAQLLSHRMATGA